MAARGATAVIIGAISLGSVAAEADTFGGFSGFDRAYLVNQDRVCAPLAVSGAAASGMPHCQTTPADAVARLSIKQPIVQSGAQASFAATAAGRTLTVTRKTGEPVVVWDAPDPIGQVTAVYASEGVDPERVAIAYTVRRAGRELTDVIAFDFGHGGTAVAPPPGPTATTGPAAPVVADDPRLTAAVTAARAAPTARAAAAWTRVLAIESRHGEALFRVAVLHARARQVADAIAALEALAASPRPDAVEWRVEARFDPAFAALRADPKFRRAVGLDGKSSTAYERFMGFGGQWEQAGTSCDKAEVRLTALRDRTFKLRVKTACEGQVMDLPFHGTWRAAADGVVLTLPTQGQQASDADDAACRFETHGDEDALHCTIGKDLEFAVLPARR